MRLSFAVGLFWTSVACCAIAQFLIVRSVRGHHRAPGPAASLPRQSDAVELAWAVIPAVALAALLFFTWHAVRDSGGGAVSPIQTASHAGVR